jgi:hypothetical protein
VEEIRKEELTLEELEAQKIELLPDREEMQVATSTAVASGG